MKKLFTILVAALCCVGMQAQNWTPLFNGKNLKGWKQVSGNAKYVAKDGCITGTCVTDGTVNSFLATKATYTDFILEFEFKMDEVQNSISTSLTLPHAPGAQESMTSPAAAGCIPSRSTRKPGRRSCTETGTRAASSASAVVSAPS